jgi:hypothetical protein
LEEVEVHDIYRNVIDKLVSIELST